MSDDIKITKLRDARAYLIEFSLRNEHVCFRNLLNFDIWNLLYSLNRDVIEAYIPIATTEETHEFIFTFCNLSKVVQCPKIHLHSQIHRSDTGSTVVFQSQSVSNLHDAHLQGLKLTSVKDVVRFQLHNDHEVDVSVCMTMDFEAENLPEVLEGVMAKMMKTIYSRLKGFIENFKST